MRFKSYISELPSNRPPKAAAPSKLARMSSNENPLGASPLAIEAIRKIADQVGNYPDMFSTDLRVRLAERAGLSPDMVLCTNGSDEMILNLCVGFLEPGDEVVLADGTFVSYVARSLMSGARLIRVPLKNYTHDLDAMADAITPNTRLVFVCNPNNPTGTMVGKEAVQRFLDRVPDDVLVVMDEAYIEFVQNEDYPDLLPELRKGRRNILLLRTLAKIYGLAGLRLGYAYGHPDVIDYLGRVRPTFSVNIVSQAAGLAALEDHEHIERSLKHASESRAFFERELRALGLEPIPSYTNFIAVPIGGDDVAIVNALRERGYAITALKGWGLPGCIRISFGTSEENQGFIAALRDVLASRS
jgi:histidinol-phosphate aminotransferase